MNKLKKFFDKISVVGITLLLVYFLFPLIVSVSVIVVDGPEMYRVNDPNTKTSMGHYHYESSRLKVGMYLTLLWWIPAVLYCPFKWFLPETKKMKHK